MFNIDDSQDNNNNMKNRGVGLGLQISNKLVKYLCKNQKIELESEINKGSCFSFHLFNFEKCTVNMSD